MISDVVYLMPPHKLNNPRHRRLDEAETMIYDLRSDSRQRLTVAIHEANHKLTAESFGMSAWYGGSAIKHIKETDEWLVVFGRIQFATKQYSALSAEQAARLHCAGRVAELVLLGSASNDASDGDFEGFIYSGKGPSSELILVWKQAEESMLKDLTASIRDQREIIYEAQRFEQTIWPELAIQKVNPESGAEGKSL